MKAPPTYILTDSDRDGLLAGYAAWRRVVRSGAEPPQYHALGTGEGPESFTRTEVPQSVTTGKPGIVYVLDLTLPDKVLAELADRHHNVIVIDHHASTADRIVDGIRKVGHSPGNEERKEGASWDTNALKLAAEVHDNFYLADEPSFVYVNHIGPQYGFFGSVRHSAAGLAWLFFFGKAGENAPYTVAAVEDYDLWRFALWGSHELCLGLDVLLADAGASAVPRTQKEAQRTMEVLDGIVGFEHAEASMIDLGRPVLSYKRGLARSIARGACLVTFDTGDGKVQVPAVSNAPRELSSFVGDAVCEAFPDAPFAIVFGPDAARRSFHYGLYSRTEGVDCSAIAVHYGGGGHAAAAGFDVPFNEGDDVSLFVPRPVSPARLKTAA